MTRVFKSTRVGAVLSTVLAIFVGFGVLGTVGACSKASNETSVAAAAPAPILDVTTVVASNVTAPRQLILSGTLTAADEARVAAGAVGKVLGTFVERGKVVQKGALLVRLDGRTVGAQAQEAAAMLEGLRVQQAQTQSDCERNEQLFKKGALSKVDYDRSRTQCASTKWSVSAAEARKDLTAQALRDTEIRAPFAGMVVERFVSAGEYVRPDSPVVALVGLEALRVELTVPESEVAYVKTGMSLDFQTATGEGETVYHATTRYVGPSVRRQTRDAIVEAVVENAGEDLRPGMFVTAKLKLGDQTLPALPPAAIRIDGSLRHVFAIVGGRVEERLVQVADAYDGVIPVLSGLQAGDEVVADANANVRDGAHVRATSKATSAPPVSAQQGK